MTDPYPRCETCGHRAWTHGTQAATPATPVDGEPCHAATGMRFGTECECTGYVNPDKGGKATAP